MNFFRVAASYDANSADFRTLGRGAWRVEDCWSLPPGVPLVAIGELRSHPGRVLFCVSVRAHRPGHYCNPHRMLNEVLQGRGRRAA